MFFGKNKKTLRLIKQHPEMLLGCEYFVVENALNPKKIKIGTGLTQLFLKNQDGEEYLIEGNSSRIKEYFAPTMSFNNQEGRIVKLKQSVGSLMKNQLLKEIAPCSYDEKIQLGMGVSEHFFIQKETEKVIKVYGNSKQIKNLFEEIETTPTKSFQANVQQVALTEESGSQSIQIKGIKGDKGDRGEVGPRGLIGPQGPRGVQGEKGDVGPEGPRGPKGEKGDKGESGPIGLRGAKGEKGDAGVMGPQGPQGEAGPAGKDGKDGERGPIGLPGPVGPQGQRGPQGEKGSMGIPGPQGEQGPKGEKGDPGKDGKDGTSPVINAQYPLVVKDNSISLDEKHVLKLLEKFKGSDNKKLIEQLQKMWSYGGGGGMGVLQNGNGIVKSVSDMNFTGNGVTVTNKGSVVTVDISGGAGPIGGVAQIVAGSGITLDPPEGTGIVTISTLGGFGNTGATGPQGNTGATGPQGNTGATGPAGSTGSIGPQGNTGAAGAQGNTGEPGPIGPTGSIGPQGNTGATGPQGNTGASGIVGDYVTSLRGLTGIVGLSAGSNITITQSGNTLTISSTASGGISGDYVISVNGLTGAVTDITPNIRGWFFL